MCTQIHNVYTLNNVHNSTEVGRGEGCCHIIFLVFSSFHSQKGVQVIKGLKLKIIIMSSVTMLKHNIIYKRCFVIYNKSCLERLKMSVQVDYFIKLTRTRQDQSTRSDIININYTTVGWPAVSTLDR